MNELLSQLNTTKSQGPDGLHPRVLKEIKDSISTPLSNIYNTSLGTGELPGEWKKANISAIFKKGNKKISSKLSSSQSHLYSMQNVGKNY